MAYGTSNRPLRLLIVEDETWYAANLLQSLQRGPNPDDFPLEINLATDGNRATEYINSDSIEIYIVDLEIPEHEGQGVSEDVGRRVAERVLEYSNAGLIIHSKIPAERNADAFIELGADDYIEKGNLEDEKTVRDLVRRKARALWRRVQLLRPTDSRGSEHPGRTFLIGRWRFVVGDRELHDSSGNRVRLSATEHAFLQHLINTAGHEIDRERFNVDILERKGDESEMRIDNLVYRLRNKLDHSLFLSKGKGRYKLMNVKQVRSL